MLSFDFEPIVMMLRSIGVSPTKVSRPLLQIISSYVCGERRK